MESKQDTLKRHFELKVCTEFERETVVSSFDIAGCCCQIKQKPLPKGDDIDDNDDGNLAWEFSVHKQLAKGNGKNNKKAVQKEWHSSSSVIKLLIVLDHVPGTSDVK